ncbi:MAG: 30S ribosomal protein S15 [Candidatus Micrarchaeaceae archaeon]
MARMHTKKRGKSKSRKPVVELGVHPEGVMPKEEIEEQISGYIKKGIEPRLIGQYLKDKHKVPYVKQVFGKRLTAVMNEKGYDPEYPQDLMDLMRRAVNLRVHLSNNKQDIHNKLRLSRIESKIWRLTRYYKKVGKLDMGWSYDPEKAALIVKR